MPRPISSVSTSGRSRLRHAVLFFGLLSLVAAGCQARATATPAPEPTVATAAPPASTLAPTPPAFEAQPIPNGPVLLRDDLTLRQVLEAGGGTVKLVLNPADGRLYYLQPGNGIYRVNLDDGSKQRVASATAITGNAAGMAIGPDGSLYVVTNAKVGENQTRAVIRRAAPAGEDDYTWTTLASTDPYPLSNTPFDHLYNGIVVSPDGEWIYVNAGSRTDHGEVESNNDAFPDVREVALTARILRLSTTAEELVLPNDEAALADLGVVYATGTRNAFDLAFAPNGDLFAIDNGPDADFPDELNWIRPGLHYGFPWRFGIEDNPQQFPGYDAAADPRLSQDFTAVQIGAYHDDPAFPPVPGEFTGPLVNHGPAATVYRSRDGAEHDAAAEGQTLTTFTPHISPLGLVFAADTSLPADLQAGSDGSSSAFLVSWGAAGGDLTYRGQELLHLRLTKQGDNYAAVTTAVARGFQNPIDAVLIENRLYVLEFGGNGAIWELTFAP